MQHQCFGQWAAPIAVAPLSGRRRNIKTIRVMTIGNAEEGIVLNHRKGYGPGLFRLLGDSANGPRGENGRSRHKTDDRRKTRTFSIRALLQADNSDLTAFFTSGIERLLLWSGLIQQLPERARFTAETRAIDTNAEL